VPDALTDRAALALVVAELDERLERAPGRLIVGIAGPPGTGKSTFARRLLGAIGVCAALLPMDGFHLSNRQLDRLGRRDRKGAPDTFDVEGYVATLRRTAEAADDVYVPDFDRTLDESVAAGLVVPADARLVITEGNYLALADGAWGSVRSEIHRLYYLDCPAEVRRERLIARHVAGGRSRVDAQRWVDLVDGPNAALIARTEAACDVTLYVR
jgi:pantothenate kinase